MSNVIDLPCVTKLNSDPDRILRAALDKLEDVIIIGYDKEGEEYFKSSIPGGPEVLWHLERAKHKLIEIVDNHHAF